MIVACESTEGDSDNVVIWGGCLTSNLIVTRFIITLARSTNVSISDSLELVSLGREDRSDKCLTAISFCLSI